MFKIWWAQEAICGALWRPPRIEDENPYVLILVRTRVAHHPRFQVHTGPRRPKIVQSSLSEFSKKSSHFQLLSIIIVSLGQMNTNG